MYLSSPSSSESTAYHIRSPVQASVGKWANALNAVSEASPRNIPLETVSIHRLLPLGQFLQPKVKQNCQANFLDKGDWSDTFAQVSRELQ